MLRRNPQQNFTTERKHRHLFNVTRALIFHANLPKCFWYFSLCHARYLINRLCIHTINNNTLCELLFKEPPTFTHLKVFGSLTYANTITRHRGKLDPMVTKCVFLGYPNWIRGYLLFYINTRATLISRDCVFYENTFPYTNFLSTYTQNNDHTHSIIPFIFDILIHPSTPPTTVDPTFEPLTTNLPLSPPSNIISSPTNTPSHASLLPYHDLSLTLIIPMT